MEFDTRPAALSSVLALGAGVVAAVVPAITAPLALAAGGLGLLSLTVGVLRGSRRATSLGAFALFVGVLVAGVLAAPVEPLLVGGTATVLAWDFGQQAVTLGDQLGRDVETARAEFAHAGASTAVGAVTAGGGYLVFELSAGGQPVAAVVFLLLAVIVLTSAFRS